jgi:hypothetical protein
MDVTATNARSFTEARALFMSDGDTLMWLADSGANYHMTSMRGDFLEDLELTDPLWALVPELLA